jgi:hypothetical protein
VICAEHFHTQEGLDDILLEPSPVGTKEMRMGREKVTGSWGLNITFEGAPNSRHLFLPPRRLGSPRPPFAIAR